MLGPIEVFVPITDSARSRAFYVELLGLREVEETEFALILRSGTTIVRCAKTRQFTPQPFTIIGWPVADVAQVLARLAGAGVRPVFYDALPQDAAGIWSPAPGVAIAWFKDPDGNLLSFQSGAITE